MNIFKLILLLFLTAVLAKKKGSKKSKSKKEQKPNIDEKVYCASCNAVIQTVMGKLYSNKKSEPDVYDALSKICDVGNYMTFDYQPNFMQDGCESLISFHEEKLEKFLMNRKTEDIPTLQDSFCKDITKICENVVLEDRSKMHSNSDMFRIDLNEKPDL